MPDGNTQIFIGLGLKLTSVFAATIGQLLMKRRLDFAPGTRRFYVLSGISALLVLACTGRLNCDY